VLNQAFDPSGAVPNIPTRTKAKKPTHNFVPSEAFSTRDQRYHDVPGQGPGDR
jgi:hypothetical protein